MAHLAPDLSLELTARLLKLKVVRSKVMDARMSSIVTQDQAATTIMIAYLPLRQAPIESELSSDQNYGRSRLQIMPLGLETILNGVLSAHPPRAQRIWDQNISHLETKILDRDNTIVS